jgi:hypothetical protein
MLTKEQERSEACYAKGQFRYDVDGTTILNELGVPAKTGQVILRDARTGFPLFRFGIDGPINLRTKEES